LQQSGATVAQYVVAPEFLRHHTVARLVAERVCINKGSTMEVTEMVGILIIIAIVASCAFALHRIGSPYTEETHPRHA
jgi:hypothetical protein